MKWIEDYGNWSFELFGRILIGPLHICPNCDKSFRRRIGLRKKRRILKCKHCKKIIRRF